jgi:hypothetical protein
VKGNTTRAVVVRIEPSGHLRTWPSQTDRSKSQLIKLSSVYFNPSVAPGVHTVGETEPPSCRPICFPALENEQDSDAEFTCVKMCTPLDRKGDELHCNCKMIKTISCSQPLTTKDKMKSFGDERHDYSCKQVRPCLLFSVMSPPPV